MNRSFLRRLLANLLLAGVAVVVGLVLIEGTVRVLGLMKVERALATGDSEAYETSPTEVDVTAEEAPASRWILHPFRGVTPRPRYDDEETAKLRFRSNILGVRSFVDDPRTDLAADELVIAIFGGSFARIVSHHGAPALHQALTDAMGPDAPVIRVVNFAISGYKQPQQSFELAEALLLGTPIDVVVNIDGYNEAALALSDANLGHHPLYPHFGFWNLAVGATTGSLSIEQIEWTAEVTRSRRQVEGWRTWIRDAKVGRSAVVRGLVGRQIARLEAAAVQAEQTLQDLPNRLPERDRFALDDPCLGTDPEYDCLELTIDLWRRGSHLMASVAERFGAHYVHVLQPNQYVEGSKPLSAEERQRAWNPQWEWSRAAIHGYPHLRAAGRELATEGIDFHDLTQIFADRTESIYTDICCHVNPLGARIIGAEIGGIVADALDVEAATTITAAP